MQTEKSQDEGKRLMPEMRFTEFPALSVDQGVGNSRSASETDNCFFFLTPLKNRSFKRNIYLTLYDGQP